MKLIQSARSTGLEINRHFPHIFNQTDFAGLLSTNKNNTNFNLANSIEKMLRISVISILVLLSCSSCMAADGEDRNYWTLIGIPAGIAAGVILLLIIFIVCLVKRKRRSRAKKATEHEKAAAAEAKRKDFEEQERASSLQRQIETDQIEETRRREVELQQMAIAEEANRRQMEEQQTAEARRRIIGGVPILRETPISNHYQSQYQPPTYTNIDKYEAPYRPELSQIQPAPSYEPHLPMPTTTQRPISDPLRKLPAGKNPFGFAEKDVWRPPSMHYDEEDRMEETPTKLPEIPRVHQHYQRHNSSTRREDRPVVPKKPTKYYNESDSNIPIPDY